MTDIKLYGDFYQAGYDVGLGKVGSSRRTGQIQALPSKMGKSILMTTLPQILCHNLSLRNAQTLKPFKNNCSFVKEPDS